MVSRVHFARELARSIHGSPLRYICASSDCVWLRKASKTILKCIKLLMRNLTTLNYLFVKFTHTQTLKLKAATICRGKKIKLMTCKLVSVASRRFCALFGESHDVSSCYRFGCCFCCSTQQEQEQMHIKQATLHIVLLH